MAATQTIRMWKKGDLSDSEHSMVTGVKQAGVTISDIGDLLGFSSCVENPHTTSTGGYQRMI